MCDFSVCMCVYHKDNARDFREAVESIYDRQTLKPSEVVIVVDGPIYGELDDYVSTLEKDRLFKVVRIPENLGHAGARQAGLMAASNNLVAIMDADDISVPNRFEMQIKAYEENPHMAVIGGQINEFIGSQDNIVGTRIVPIADADIKKYLKSRCPMNLVTVMFRKDYVQAVGGYQEWFCEEDYYLWIRLAKAGYTFKNLPDNLVNVRVGDEMYRRRGGWKYFKSEAGLQGYMLRHGVISLPRYCFNVLGRFAIQVAMPNKLRGLILQKLFRKRKNIKLDIHQGSMTCSISAISIYYSVPKICVRH